MLTNALFVMITILLMYFVGEQEEGGRRPQDDGSGEDWIGERYQAMGGSVQEEKWQRTI